MYLLFKKWLCSIAMLVFRWIKLQDCKAVDLYLNKFPKHIQVHTQKPGSWLWWLDLKEIYM